MKFEIENCLSTRTSDEYSIPIWFVHEANFNEVQTQLPASSVNFIQHTGFELKPSNILMLPDQNGKMAAVLMALETYSSEDQGELEYQSISKYNSKLPDLFLPGKLLDILPRDRVYYFANHPHNLPLALLSWILAQNRFFLTAQQVSQPYCQLVGVDSLLKQQADLIARAVCMGRELINLPANLLNPNEFAWRMISFAKSYNAHIKMIKGRDLLTENFPLIHAVGRGASQEPCLVDMSWGNEHHQKITLVGKGVCFDTGGLDIKTSPHMRLMKKDMSGAACAFALSAMIMQQNLPVRLRLICPIVENSISALSYRPGDIYKARNNLFVEIGDTDAEGRLILADALSLACEEKPDLLINFASLTGAARVALGPEVVPFYTRSSQLAQKIMFYGLKEQDPVWHLPLWQNYQKNLKSFNSDLNNISSDSFAGSMIAGLFLENFVTPDINWIHFDLYGWNLVSRPGRPQGGEIQTARLLYQMLKDDYAKL